MLANLLLGRGALNVLFGLFFLLAHAAEPGQSFRQAGYYLCADGLLALLSAGLLARRQGAPALTGVAIVDGVLRVLLGAWFLLVPALTTFVATSILVLVMVCAFTIVVGFVEMVAAFAFGLRGRRHPLPSAAASPWTLLLAGAVAIACGIALFAAFPDAGRMRMVFGIYTLLLGLAFGAAGLRRTPQQVFR